MGNRLYQDATAEHEANRHGDSMMHSQDIFGDLAKSYGADQMPSVRIHSDSGAQGRARNAGVDAIASGHDIYFGKGAYPAKSPAQKGLLAHEMTHVMQQSEGAAPYGAEQGGLLDWFRSRFGGQQQEEETPLNQSLVADQETGETQEAGEIHETAETQEAGETQEESRWKSSEDAQQVDENVVFNDALPELFASGCAYISDIDDGLGQYPIFETHTFTPRAGIDDENFLYMHSFVGLRYTAFNPNTLQYERMRMKVGFCGRGPISDRVYQSDISTETPISIEKMKEVLAAMATKQGSDYHFFTYNCNDYAKEMAEVAGATVPAQLHDSILGPMGAYRSMGKAATENEGKETEGGTRFFQGGSAHAGEMKQGATFMKNYLSDAKSAARYDLCPLMFYSGLRGAVQNLQQKATAFAGVYDLPEENWLEAKRVTDVLAKDVHTAVDQVVAEQSLVSHPRVNMVSLKLNAMVDKLLFTRYPHAKRQQSDLTANENALRAEILATTNRNENYAMDPEKNPTIQRSAGQRASMMNDQEGYRRKTLFNYGNTNDELSHLLADTFNLADMPEDVTLEQFSQQIRTATTQIDSVKESLWAFLTPRMSLSDEMLGNEVVFFILDNITQGRNAISNIYTLFMTENRPASARGTTDSSEEPGPREQALREQLPVLHDFARQLKAAFAALRAERMTSPQPSENDPFASPST